MACCQILDPLNGTIENKPIAELTQYNPYYASSLSCDGKRIALVAPLENAVEVRIADFESLEVESTILSGGTDDRFWRIDWSPDGRLIAINSDRNDEDFFEVLDSESGEVLYSLEENVVSWEWSNQENKIVYVREGIESSCVQKDVEINILDMRDGTIASIELPEEIQDYIDSNDNDIICIRFISDLSW